MTLLEKINSLTWYDLINKLKDILKELVSQGGGDSRPYKVYTALLTQEVTDAPVATVLENTIGDIWFEYVGVGSYSVNSNGLFVTNKTVVFIQNTTDDSNNSSTNLGYGGTPPDNIQIITATQSVGLWSNNDGVLFNTPIEIRVYN